MSWGESLPLFFSLWGALSIAAVSGGVMVCFLRLRALRRVEASGGRPPRAADGRGARGHRLPDFIFAAALVLWLFTASFTGLLMAWLDESVTVGLVLRMSWPGLLFGPLTALLCYCSHHAAHAAGGAGAGDLGLTHAQVIAAAPRRAQIRLRLVVFTAIATVTPATLIWDVCTVLAERAFAQVLAESTPEAQALKAEALRVEALVSGGVLCVLVFGLALLAAYLGGTLLGRPIRDLGEEAHRIAEGNLSRPRLIPAEDEVGAVSAAFSTMRAHLADVLSQLRGAGVRIGSTTEEILPPPAATRRAPPSRPARWTRRAPPPRSWPARRGRLPRMPAPWRTWPTRRSRRPGADRPAPSPSWRR
jgi:HAMP domain-containing protein